MQVTYMYLEIDASQQNNNGIKIHVIMQMQYPEHKRYMYNSIVCVPVCVDTVLYP